MPTEEDTLYLTRDLKIPSAFLSDIRDVDERPRIETEDGWTLMILRIPYRDEGNDIPYITVPLGIIMKADYFVTICHHATDMLPDFMSSSVWYLKYLKQINNQSRSVEKELERSIQNAELQRLLKIEKSLVFFITSLRGNDNLLVKLKNLKSQREFFDPDLVEDVEIELRQAQDTARIYSDIPSGTMDAFASVISNNLNIVMKVLAVITIVMSIPTIVFSAYGMNLSAAGMPFSRTPWGFLIVIILSVVASIIAAIFLSRKKFF